MSTPPSVPALPDAAFLKRRTDLHERVDRASRIVSPSQVAYIRGAPHTWSEAELAVQWQGAARDFQQRGTGTNHLYVHVPFCKSICSFCNYDRLKPSTPDALKAWLERVLASIRVLGPATRGMTFHTLYFGGGTPSVLPSRMLRTVFEALDASFEWDRRASRSIELDPAVMNAAKAEAMMDHGFHHFSFGVQTLESETNAQHNRGPQSEDTVRRCLDVLPASFLGSVTVDLLIGLAGGSPERTLRDIEKLLSHPRRPSIDLFHLTPTQSYVEGHFGGSTEAARAELARYDDAFDARLEELAEARGYEILRKHSGHCRTFSTKPGFRRRRPHTWRPMLEQASIDARRVLERIQKRRPVHFRPRSPKAYSQLMSDHTGPLNLLGLGPSARSQIFGRAAVVTHPPAGADGPTSYVGQPMTLADELRTFAFFGIRDQKRVDDAQLVAFFGQTLAQALPEAVAVWADRGFARPVTGGWEFSSLPPVEMAHQLLWGLPESHLDHYITSRMRLSVSTKRRPQNRPSLR
jgi:coproporphyrinogen III oxidase-like Fe-S oxidoreductase